MQYMLLIYENENEWAAQSESSAAAMMSEYMQFTQDIAKSGHYKAGAQLQPTSSATTVRIRNGTRQTTDGPFAETREHLGGYYLVDAKDLDEAVALAQRIPAARTGSIEVRPVVTRPAAS